MKVFLSVPLVSLLSITRFAFPELLGRFCSLKQQPPTAKGSSSGAALNIQNILWPAEPCWQGGGWNEDPPMVYKGTFCGGASRGLLATSVLTLSLVTILWSSWAVTLAYWFQPWVLNLLQSLILLVYLLLLCIFSSFFFFFYWILFITSYLPHTCFQFYSAKPKPLSLKF